LTDLNTLSASKIQAGLGTRFIGRTVVYRAEVGSTNDEARRIARAGAPEGTLVITDYQNQGRGRLDRDWVAPPGSGLLMSLVFRPELAARQVQRLTMLCGLAVAETIEFQTGLEVGLKWPNDVVIAGSKVCGILSEIEFEGPKVSFAVVGIGVNVNLDPALLPADLCLTATSLSREMGAEVARLPLLQALLKKIEKRYCTIGLAHSLHHEWAGRLVTLGKAVTVSGTTPALQGMAEGVDVDGALLVRLADGTLEKVLAGDVSLHR
jgi:BirA family biotin operon repressor/biotin-[acetyl-CoA-carboxylase] ligase